MTKKNLKKVFKKWGNSVLSSNIKFWRCTYCGHLIKDDKPFGIVRVNGSLVADIFCSQSCLKIHMMKLDALRTD